MDTKKIIMVLVVALVVEGAAISAIGLKVFEKDTSENEFTLYIGLSYNGGEYTYDDAEPIIDEIVLEKQGGLTKYQAKGAYTLDDGSKGEENTWVYIIVGISVADVYYIADKIIENLHQESILITTAKEKIEFYHHS